MENSNILTNKEKKNVFDIKLCKIKKNVCINKNVFRLLKSEKNLKK